MPDRWEILQNEHGHPLLADILMIHVALLPSGKVLAFAGSEHDEHHARKFNSVLWDPAHPDRMTVLPAPEADLFCAGHCLLPDGNVLVAGGTANYDHEKDNPHAPYHFTGIANCYLFDWRTETWSAAPPMRYARWYPTLLPLADGRVLTISGHGGPQLPSHEVLETENYDPARNSWEPARLTVPPLQDTGHFWLIIQFRPMVYYTRLHGLKDGSIFSSTALQVRGRRRTRLIDPVSNRLTTVGPAPCGMLVPLMSHVYSRANFTSVLLPLRPPDYAESVLIAGGRTARRFDLTARKRAWRRAGRRRPYKMRAYATGLLLPDGSVLVIGGGRSEKVPRWYWPWSEVGGYDRDANPTPERYLPESDTWLTGNPPAGYPPIPRMYHTSAVVLPDGRVLMCGSNHDSQRNSGGSRPDHAHHGQDARELRLELYWPPYLFDDAGAEAERVEVRLSADAGGYDEDLRLVGADSGRIDRVTMLRCASVTHAYSSDQRLIELVVTARAAGEVTVRTPPTRQLAVPGYYLVFAVDAAGVPSVGRYFHLR